MECALLARPQFGQCLVYYTVQYRKDCVKTVGFHKVSVAQLVEYWITVPKEGGSILPGVFGAAAAEFAEFDLA